jgi:prohibitin 2
MAIPPRNPRRAFSDEPRPIVDVNNTIVPRLIGIAVILFVLAIASSSMTYIVQPGTRGIKVTLGKATDKFLPEGFGFKTPFITSIVPVNVKQKTQALKADCFSSDLQQVGMDLRVLYRVPEQNVVQIYKQFAGDPFDSLIAPRVQEAIKEVTAAMTAELIVKSREEIKSKAIASARTKIGTTLSVEDIVIRNIELSQELERAIEAKMVAEQQAAQARFTQVQTQVEAETAIIKARGEAEAITVRGEALKLNPAFLRLQIVEKWNGRSPVVVPANANNAGAGLLLPIGTPIPAPAP